MKDYQAVALQLMAEFKYVPWCKLIDAASEWMQGDVTAYQMRQSLQATDAEQYNKAYKLERDDNGS